MQCGSRMKLLVQEVQTFFASTHKDNNSNPAGSAQELPNTKGWASATKDEDTSKDFIKVGTY